MKVRIFCTNQLIQYPIQLMSPHKFNVYRDVHVMEENGQYKVFAGWELIPKEMTKASVIFHGTLSTLNVIALQLIHAYGLKGSGIFYQKHLIYLMSCEPLMSWDQFCNLIHVDKEWLLKTLHIDPRVSKVKDICPANAYVLSKLKNPKPFMNRACVMKPVEFSPLVHAELRRLRNK